MLNVSTALRSHTSLSRTLFIVYSILTLIFYYSYGMLDYFRLNHSLELDTAIQYERWSSTFGALFYYLFFIALLTIHVVYRNNMRGLHDYLVLIAALFIGMACINAVISFAIPLPMSKFGQPLIIVTVLLITDLLAMWFRNKEMT
ncbi:hypothetical protein [Paenibacillus alvei]|uniref:Uncharacterized protein n=1 Tax=Paenibacillus alvei TaxID=44250 RepID=A0A383RD54_PAEAL|nr:hypothetical protein [Paenibacillus alvei]SYX84239.1 conserved membrane protein of unknown function [Paenibacillus alvei]